MPAAAKMRHELHAVRAAVTELLKQAPQAAIQVADVLQALDRLERLIEEVPPRIPASERQGRRNQRKTYRVEGLPGQEALCEYRADDPDRPFRCPKATYDALARVMADAPKPAKFDEIARRLKKEMGSLPALYQLRVTLRFWTQPGIGLVEKVRARYIARDPARFARAANTVWSV